MIETTLVVIDNFEVTQYRKGMELFYTATLDASLIGKKLKVKSDEVQADILSVDANGKLQYAANGMSKAIQSAYGKIKSKYGVEHIDFEKSTQALKHFKADLT